jgi:FtsP/CotA-like multicopper oxidase with cupredoxin domain
MHATHRILLAGGRVSLDALLASLAAVLVITPLASMMFDDDDPLERLPPANAGAFVGGRSGTAADAGIENAVQNPHARSSFDAPTGGAPSPLFGAQPFTQQLLLFEEFGPRPLPAVSTPTAPMSLPRDSRHGPAGAALDAFLAQDLYPPDTSAANTSGTNPWRPAIEAFLGRALAAAPLEGRPGGPGWAHQREQEFPTQVWFASATTGARTNGGLRDSRQRHGYAAGEFGPGGLYHNTTGTAGHDATTAGIEVRFHPAMPVQDSNALWTFDGTFPPKLLCVRLGESVLFRHFNALPIDPSANFGFGLHTLTTHEHNGHTPAESDGFANAFFFPGQYYDYCWPLQLAGYDTINVNASDPRAGAPDGNGGVHRLRGDWRETMSTHWFHDHMLDFTAQNVFKGDAAMMNYYGAIDRGNEGIDDGVNLRLPSGTALDWGNRDYDVNLVVADKAFARDGQLWFNIFNKDGFLGDVLTTNFQYKPFLEVRARRYRFRILNGAVSRYLRIALVDDQGHVVPFHMVANDGNLMEHTVAFDGTLGTTAGVLPGQGIAERYDIVVDFSRFQPGRRLYLVNLAEHQNGRRPNRYVPLGDVTSGRYHATARDDDHDGFADRWVDGDPCVGKFLEFRVREYAGTDRSMNPADFIAGHRTMVPLARASAVELAHAPHRTFEFGRGGGGNDAKPWSIKTDGGASLRADPRRVSAEPDIGQPSAAGLGHLEIWTIRTGGGGWSHPVHVHFEEGVLLDKDGSPPPEWERWARKDMYRVGPMPDEGESIQIAIRIREFAGTYLEHCHNTQHEDNAMLLRWDAVHSGQLTPLPAPIPTWEGVEFVNTLALPTARNGDGVGTRR